MQTFQDELLGRIAFAPQQYHRLIIILNSGNRTVGTPMKDVASKLGLSYTNLGLDLSQMLLDLTERQRALKVPKLVDQILGSIEDKPTVLDHIEILFEPGLKQDSLRLLQGLSRNRIILAVWNGEVINGYLTYAAPEHPEYRRYPVRDLNILSISDFSE